MPYATGTAADPLTGFPEATRTDRRRCPGLVESGAPYPIVTQGDSPRDRGRAQCASTGSPSAGAGAVLGISTAAAIAPTTKIAVAHQKLVV